MRSFVLGLVCISIVLGGCQGAAVHRDVPCPASFTACGGDLAGTWTFASRCSPSVLVAGCPEATVHLTSDDLAGTLTFGADKGYTLDLEVDQTLMLELPAVCQTRLGVTSCAAMSGQGLNGQVSVTQTCSGDASQSCSCTTMESGPSTLMGTYVTSGNQISNVLLGGDALVDYCVKGDELELSSNIPSSSGVDSFFIFTRQ